MQCSSSSVESIVENQWTLFNKRYCNFSFIFTSLNAIAATNPHPKKKNRLLGCNNIRNCQEVLEQVFTVCMCAKAFLYEINLKSIRCIFRHTFLLFLLLPFASFHSTMQCNFVSNGGCCRVTRSRINIIFFPPGMHLQHYCVCRLWCGNSGNVRCLR